MVHYQVSIYLSFNMINIFASLLSNLKCNLKTATRGEGDKEELKHFLIAHSVCIGV